MGVSRPLCSRLFVVLAAFSRRFWIEISPDVFLKGTVGEGGYLFDMRQIM